VSAALVAPRAAEVRILTVLLEARVLHAEPHARRMHRAVLTAARAAVGGVLSADDALALITRGLLVLDGVLHDTVTAWRVAEDHVLPGLLLRGLIGARGVCACRSAERDTYRRRTTELRPEAHGAACVLHLEPCARRKFGSSRCSWRQEYSAPRAACAPDAPGGSHRSSRSSRRRVVCT